jgi:tetratricopeptide (TPR) repeat protein
VQIADLVAQAYASHDAGDTAQALCLLAQGLTAAPGNTDLLFARGNVLRESGDIDGAAADFQAVLMVHPAHAKAHNNLGAILLARDELAPAQLHFEAALDADVQFADATFNLGSVLQRRGQYAEALGCFERAAALRPGYAAALLRAGWVLSELGRLEEAAGSMRAAMAAAPEDAGTHNDLGLLLTELNQSPEAVAAHERAAALVPQSDEYKTNLALSLMQAGDFAPSWALYEHRWRAEGRLRPAYRYDPVLEWGGGSIAGKRLRVWWEQGLGDTLCFARYLPVVMQRFAPAALTLECQPGLGRLLRHSLPGVEVIEQGQRGSAFDLHVPLMSLPQRCGIAAEVPPVPPLAMTPTAEAVTRWRDRVAALPEPRVGVVWASGLWPTGNAPARRHRSVAPDAFERLLRVPGISFISLQKGAGTETAARWRELPGFTDWSDDLGDFDDTAALISCLDLTLTVDTSVAHLAGSLGGQTWVPLRFEGGNLWAAGAEHSAWYPRMRVFRQKRQSQWDEPVARIAAALAEFAAGWRRA